MKNFDSPPPASPTTPGILDSGETWDFEIEQPMGYIQRDIQREHERATRPEEWYATELTQETLKNAARRETIIAHNQMTQGLKPTARQRAKVVSLICGSRSAQECFGLETPETTGLEAEVLESSDAQVVANEGPNELG
jgi:hypothetical protein